MAFLTHFQIFGKNLKSNLYQTPCASYVGQDVSEILCDLEKCVFTYFETSKEPLFDQQWPNCTSAKLQWQNVDVSTWKMLKAGGRGVEVQLMTWGYYPDIQNSFPPGKTPGLKNISKRTFPKDLIWNVGSRCWIRLYRLSCHWPWILECPNWHELSAADSISTNSADFIQLCELEFLANEFDGGRWGEVW